MANFLDDIARDQQAAEAARQALPDRYALDGVALKDIAQRVQMEHQSLQALKSSATIDPPQPDDLLRLLSATHPQASAAFGLYNQGFAVSPLDEHGTPLTAPTRDPAVMASWWQPDGPYVTRWPGVPCGPEGGMFGIMVSGKGAEWWRSVATIHQPSRAERALSPTELLGVVGPTDPWEDDDQPQKPDELRATVSATVWFVEDLPVHRAVTQTWFGPLRGRLGQAAMMAGRPPQPRQVSGMVWNWPHGETLPVGKELRPGVWSLPAIPALGAVLVLAGVTFKVGLVPALLSPPPDWVLSALRAA